MSSTENLLNSGKAFKLIEQICLPAVNRTFMNRKQSFVNSEEKPPDNGTNTSINQLESNGKFWIVLSENVGKRSHNVAFSQSKNSFSDQVNIIFLFVLT